MATAAVWAGALDMLVENVALFAVTMVDWPPHGGLWPNYLLLTAALASWAKVSLLLVAAFGWAVFALRSLNFRARGAS